MTGGPDITVVIPSHGRRLRVRWLLNALEEQTLAGERFEVVVVHDYDDRDTRDIFERHPLAVAGILRHVRIPAGTGRASRQRNLGWRTARAPLVAFTDDDCRPDPRWLEELLEAAERAPGAVIQGATRSDPLEDHIWAGPHVRSLHVDPPGPFAQTCNIAYPREVLERVGGFDESMSAPAGEDLDLATRARHAGAPYCGAPAALVYHAVESYSLLGMIRLNLKWQDIAYLAKRHPSVRGSFTLGVFWRGSHFRLVLGAGALATVRHFPLAGLFAAPYLMWAVTKRGTHKRALLASTMELPGRVVVDCAEVATLLAGSLRHRTLVL